MSRMRVPADQERFTEAIDAYGNADDLFGLPEPRRVRAHILAPFPVQRAVETSQFTILPAEPIALPGARSAFVVPIDLEVSGIGATRTAHYKCQAIAALASITYGVGFTAPRDDYLLDRDPLSREEFLELAMQYNVVIPGTGSGLHRFASTDEEQCARRLIALVNSLPSAGGEPFKKVMQAIRLHQLALLTRKMDFDLGFSLLVASLEAMAQIAISRDETTEVSYSNVELQIKDFCESQRGDVLGWFKMKVRDQGRLKARFCQYVFQYAPIEAWHEVNHPFKASLGLAHESLGNTDVPWGWVTKGWDEIYPTDLSKEELRDIISSTYDDRSQFLHAGSKTTHDSPQSYRRYFDEIAILDHKSGLYVRRTVVNFETLSTISRIALLTYLSEATATPTA